MLSDRPVLIDTCTLINLEASGESELLLRALSPSCLLCNAVSRESLFLRSDQIGQPPRQIDLQGLLQGGSLTLCQPESPDEEAMYVSLAAELDDGEALSLAIASARGFGLATDERKARRIAQELGSVPLFSTVEIIHAVRTLGTPKIAEMIRLIEFRGRFVPHQSMPLSDWWNSSKLVI
jgi:predicted nucleic acid-binding protein